MAVSDMVCLGKSAIVAARRGTGAFTPALSYTPARRAPQPVQDKRATAAQCEKTARRCGIVHFLTRVG